MLQEEAGGTASRSSTRALTAHDDSYDDATSAYDDGPTANDDGTSTSNDGPACDDAARYDDASSSATAHRYQYVMTLTTTIQHSNCLT